MSSALHPERDLKLELRVTPPKSCEIHKLDGEIVSVNQHPTHGGFYCEIVYRTDEGDEKTFHTFKKAGCNCPANVFAEHGCVPTVTGVDRDSCLVTTFLSSREQATDLLEELSDHTENLAVRRISDNGIKNPSDVVDYQSRTIDLSELTEKQKEAIQRVSDAGYYEQPRETTLSEVASELDITQSALSQRLRAGENKLFQQLFAGEGGEKTDGR